ncbi:RBBP9/YdeN family alpha/beta hydrolase [Chitinibacter sp. S2-10]|uniref:RBBP9/YdeN family alpha/beta hydrolase n=1 Tax=Chitinibacter sp. S2-10 TaxID=3373597 RepID=UPI003977563C
MNAIDQWLEHGHRILIAPGWNSSPEGHWQSVWQQQYPQFSRIEQTDWQHPKAFDWVNGFIRKIAESNAPTIIVAHSLGCATLAHWATLYGQRSPVVGALLVAPADVMRPEAPDEFQGFVPLPIVPLPFRSWVVASTNDPSCNIDRAIQLSQIWRSRLQQIGEAGHINIASGHGEWQQGLDLLDQFITSELTSQLMSVA